MSTTDRIEKKVVLRAPRARVWRALADADEFASWFGMRLNGAFTPGARLMAKIFDPPGFEQFDIEVQVERVEPERLLSYRWHPGAPDPQLDYSKQPRTLVELTLEEVAGGTQLTVVESGFDQLPADRRSKARGDNDEGWQWQIENIRRHVEK